MLVFVGKNVWILIIILTMDIIRVSICRQKIIEVVKGVSQIYRNQIREI